MRFFTSSGFLTLPMMISSNVMSLNLSMRICTRRFEFLLFWYAARTASSMTSSCLVFITVFLCFSWFIVNTTRGGSGSPFTALLLIGCTFFDHRQQQAHAVGDLVEHGVAGFGRRQLDRT